MEITFGLDTYQYGDYGYSRIRVGAPLSFLPVCVSPLSTARTHSKSFKQPRLNECELTGEVIDCASGRDRFEAVIDCGAVVRVTGNLTAGKRAPAKGSFVTASGLLGGVISFDDALDERVSAAHYCNTGEIVRIELGDSKKRSPISELPPSDFKGTAYLTVKVAGNKTKTPKQERLRMPEPSGLPLLAKRPTSCPKCGGKVGKRRSPENRKYEEFMKRSGRRFRGRVESEYYCTKCGERIGRRIDRYVD